uniref:Uncharacterized protein n=1 Tax=Anguilla anguilla TaxID=7936 RepID=A0A0E9RDD2_ANGAN
MMQFVSRSTRVCIYSGVQASKIIYEY